MIYVVNFHPQHPPFHLLEIATQSHHITSRRVEGQEGGGAGGRRGRRTEGQEEVCDEVPQPLNKEKIKKSGNIEK